MGQDVYDHYKNLDKQVPKLEQVLTRKQQHFLFLEIYPFYEKETERLLTKPDVRSAYDKKSVIVWNQLSSSIREVLVDLTYRGDNSPRTREGFVPALVNFDGDSFVDVMDSENRLWADVDNNRRENRENHL